jgi:TRAP-type C4-dicarboxylate transport system permease small subunit
MSYYLLSALLLLLVLLLFISIVLRLFAFPIFWSEEVVTLLFVWVVYLGAMMVFQKNRHVAVEFVYEAVSDRMRRVIDLIGSVLTIGLFVVMTIASTKLFLVQMHTMTPALLIPYSIFSSAAVICFIFMLIMALHRAVKLFRTGRRQRTTGETP